MKLPQSKEKPMAIADELSKLGKEIEAAKKQVAQLEGRKAEVMDRLKKEFDCSTIEDAEKLLGELTEEIEKSENQITKDFASLKEKFQW
jgi:flagellar biosynthesis chaperone FliJ